MPITFPQIRVGEPTRHESLSVFPLFSPAAGAVDYLLSDTALADGTLLIEEVTEDGSVPDLLVENKGDSRVLFLEGEELVGAKQNRILNTTVLVASLTKIKIPVSCVEQGRWGYNSRYFGSSGYYSPSKLRHTLKASVSRSVKEKRGHRSNQGEVWDQIEQLHAALNVKSDTAAMADAFDTYQDRIAAYRENLKYVDGATGVAVAVGARVVSIDLFDKPATCQRVWDRMLSGVVFDALEAGETDQMASVADVEQLVAVAGDLNWEQADAVGEGKEYRAESKRGDQASLLAFENTVVHGSMVTAV